MFVAVFSVSVNVSAESIESAKTALDDGRFLEAAEIAKTLNVAEALILAAESSVFYGYSIAENQTRQTIFVRAMELGEKAVNLDSDYVLPHLRTDKKMGHCNV